jgi:hypothetical protein
MSKEINKIKNWKQFLNESVEETPKNTVGKMKEFIEGLKLHLEKNGWKVNIVYSLKENENLYIDDEKVVNFGIKDSFQMGEDTLELYVMRRIDMEPGREMIEYHEEWESKVNKELVDPKLRNVDEIYSSSSIIFPETQVDYLKIPEKYREVRPDGAMKFPIYTTHFWINIHREIKNRYWLYLSRVNEKNYYT